MPTHLAQAQQSQPKTYKLSLKSIWLLPFRLCNPPPAVGKVRSFGVTPVLDVRLEDILERKHLPPLGLKDFEEWLLYVEQCPENLYFILWLQEYTVKYKQWQAYNTKSHRHSTDPRAFRLDWRSSQLAMFYQRAKQTFFTPNSHYELNLPSDKLAPFHSSNGPAFPDPAVFNEVAIETRSLLKESLRRFVTAQFNNVGNNRVICGLVAGFMCFLFGALLPIVYNFAMCESRWIRLSAMPGLWIALTLIITSLNGICLGVYIFGDLRQLRKFELSRPRISKPQPLSIPRHQQEALASMRSIKPESPTISIPPPAYQGSIRYHYPTQASASVVSSASDSSSDLSYSESDGVIHISGAYYDDDQVEGPATTPVDLTFPSKPLRSHFDDEDEDQKSIKFGATATFIHAFEPSDGCDENEKSSDMEQISAFDFDALPRPPINNSAAPIAAPIAGRVRAPSYTQVYATPPHPKSLHMLVIEPEPVPKPTGFTLVAIIRRIQSKCNIKQFIVPQDTPMRSAVDSEKRYSISAPSQRRASIVRPSPVNVTLPRPANSADAMRKQFKLVKSVPAFSSPLTKVHSPVIVRGQWEIVVRSMGIACVIACIVIGTLLAVPVPTKH